MMFIFTGNTLFKLEIWSGLQVYVDPYLYVDPIWQGKDVKRGKLRKILRKQEKGKIQL